MRKYNSDKSICYVRKGGIWKLVAAVFFVAFTLMSASAYLLKKKNKQYRDKIVEMSEDFPVSDEQKEELAKIRQREWSKANSPANRVTDEERLSDNRVEEEF